MTTPIRNDNSSTINQDRGLKARSQEHSSRSGDSQSTPQGAGNEKLAQTAEPDIARATQLFNNETDARPAGEGMVNDAGEAKSAVDRLRELISADPGAALAAFGQANQKQTAAVLGQAPAV